MVQEHESSYHFVAGELICKLCIEKFPLSTKVLTGPCPKCGKGPEMPGAQVEKVEKESQDAR